MTDEARGAPRRLPATTDCSPAARDARRARLSEEGHSLEAISGVAPEMAPEALAGSIEGFIGFARIPLGVAGPVHLSKWETPKVVAGQHRIQSDEEGYWAFCKQLVADGVIDLPDPDFLDVQIEEQSKKVSEWQQKAPTSPFHRDALAVEEALLEAMTSAKHRLYNPPADGEPVPAPKPRRGAR